MERKQFDISDFYKAVINIQEQSLQKPFTKYGRRIKIKKAGIKLL